MCVWGERRGWEGGWRLCVLGVPLRVCVSARERERGRETEGLRGRENASEAWPESRAIMQTQRRESQ